MQKLADVYKRILKLKLTGEYFIPDFANGNFSSSIHSSLASDIFASQMIALAIYDDWGCKVNLPRVMAMILYDGIRLDDEELKEQLFLSSDWGSMLAHEYESGDSDEALFATSCTELSYYLDSENVSSDGQKFLKQIDGKVLGDLRAGWANWGVNSTLVDTVATHSVAAQFLAIYIADRWLISDSKGADMEKIIMALVVHNLPAAVLGDVPLFKMSSSEKKKAESDAFAKLTEPLGISDQLTKRFRAIQNHTSDNMCFANFVGKTETDFQAKYYDETGCVNLDNQANNKALENPDIKKLLSEGCSFSETWIRYSQLKFGYDSTFKSISNIILKSSLI